MHLPDIQPDLRKSIPLIFLVGREPLFPSLVPYLSWSIPKHALPCLGRARLQLLGRVKERPTGFPLSDTGRRCPRGGQLLITPGSGAGPFIANMVCSECLIVIEVQVKVECGRARLGEVDGPWRVEERVAGSEGLSARCRSRARVGLTAVGSCRGARTGRRFARRGGWYRGLLRLT